MTFKERMIIASGVTTFGVILSIFTPVNPVWFGVGSFGYQLVAHAIKKL